MTYSIIGTGLAGKTVASLFAKAGIAVALANTRGAEAVAPIVQEFGDQIAAASLADALAADIILIAVPFLHVKDVASLKADWTGKIVVDLTNAASLPPDIQERELRGRLSSEVNAERMPGAKVVKAFNQLPMKVLSAPVPAGGRRVVFIASDHADASARIARLAGDLGFAPVELGKIGEGGRLIQARNALVFQNLIKFDGK